MFFPEGQGQVPVDGRPVDLRQSFAGLYALTRRELNQEPLSGRLCVFINRRVTQKKVLYGDRTGFRLWAKRLEAGRFLSDWSRAATREMDGAGLKLLREGIEAKLVRKRYRAAGAGRARGRRSLAAGHGQETRDGRGQPAVLRRQPGAGRSHRTFGAGSRGARAGRIRSRPPQGPLSARAAPRELRRAPLAAAGDQKLRASQVIVCAGAPAGILGDR